jgi:signal peptidase II
MKKSLMLIIAIFALDMASKFLILRATGLTVPFFADHAAAFPRYLHFMNVMPGFDLVLVWNRGVSFSMFSSTAEAGRWILAAAGLIVTAFLARLMLREKSGLSRVGYAMVIAGALGNVFDRIRYGAVVDFLDFYVGSHHWPAFNAADISISLGVALLLLSGFRKG